MLQPPTAEWGAIHGRFQPFHLGHLSYLLRASERAETVIIGITNPFVEAPPPMGPTDSVRHLPSRNPFTYFERSEIIISAILGYNRALLGRTRLVPFDVNADVDRYPSFIPLDVVQFVTVHDAWDEKKAGRFEQAGYTVEYLSPETNRVTATAVRTSMAAGDSQWRDMVPPGTVEAIMRLGLGRRASDQALQEKV